MKNIFLTFISFLLLCIFSLTAQEGVPVYFDYLSDNYYLVHPSMAGIGEGGKIRTTMRKQWFGIEDAPNLQTINGHYRLNENSGVGAIIFNDANGYHSQTGLKLTYTHHLHLSVDFRSLNQLSFGISTGLIQSNLDESEFNSVPDPIVTGGNISSFYYNMDIGASYNFLEFYAHATVLNVLNNKRNVYYKDRIDAAGVAVVENLRKYLLSVGYIFGKGDWQLEPSVMLQMTDFTKNKIIDINAKVYSEMDFGILWGGVSYRHSFDRALYYQNISASTKKQRLQQITPIIGANYKNFLVSYNYSYQMGDIRLDSGGFHQLTLGYNFRQELGKRYNCNCPAVNY